MSNNQFNLVKELAQMQEQALKKHNIHFVTIPKSKGIDLTKTKRK